MPGAHQLDVPKHRGLTVFMLPIHQPNIEVHRIEMLNGSREFCQEFMTDVLVPDSDRIGEVDDGWTVGTRWMFHERMLYTSPYVTHAEGLTHGSSDAAAVYALANERNRLGDASVRDLVGEARMLELVSIELSKHVSDHIRTGALSDQAAAIVRLFKASAVSKIVSVGLEVAGSDAAAWTEEGSVSSAALTYLMRQGGTIGGGTTEMARNVIAERVLNMPRERSLDKDVPFRDVPRSRPSGF